MKNHCVRQLVLAILLLCPAASGQAKTIYLSTTGDDNVACEAGAEFASLAAALACLQAGDTLFVRDGVYSGGPLVSLTGTAEAPIVIRGQSLEAVFDSTVRASRDILRLDNSSHVVVEGLTFRSSNRAGLGIIRSDHITVRNCVFADNYKWGIFTGFADDVLFENNECYGAKDEHGIYHSNSGDRFIIRGNHIHHNAGNGIHLNGDPELIYPGEDDDGVLNFGIVERNIIHDNGTRGGAGINMTHVRDVIVRNNLLYNNIAGGFTFYADTTDQNYTSRRALIMHNTVYFRPFSGRAVVNIQNTSEGVVIVNNILVTGGGQNPVLQVWASKYNSILSDYNVLWGVDSSGIATVNDRQTYSLGNWRNSRKSDLNSFYADPLFVSVADSLFSPSDASPAVDAAAPLDTVRAMVARLDSSGWLLGRLDSLENDDLYGNSRPAGAAADMGAIELGADPQSLYDFNRDGRFGVADALALLLNGWRDPLEQSYDIDGSGAWGVADVVALVRLMIAQPSTLPAAGGDGNVFN